jgi:hypothetical protein
MLQLVDNLLNVNNFYSLHDVFFSLVAQGLPDIGQKNVIMRDQIIEVSGQCPTFTALLNKAEKVVPPSYPDGAFWMHVFPPLGDWKAPLNGARILCPWAMAAELDDAATAADRRASLMNALKSGLRTIRQYNLPACRIVFAEEKVTRVISVWVE